MVGRDNMHNYEYFQHNVDSVDKAVEKIAHLSDQQCKNVDFLQHELIPSLGLNGENPHELPVELQRFYNKGLHIYQYPNQLAGYMIWLLHNAKSVKNLTEIGCRWGGTFILINEWLKKIGAPIEFSVAIDPIPPSPLIERYQQISTTPVHYIQNYSHSKEVIDRMSAFKPDMVFIDGDHSLNAVMADHDMVRSQADIIVHHDVFSSSCPDTTFFWQHVKQAESNFEAFEFVQQYESVQGHYLGIGVLKHRSATVDQ